MFKGEWAVLVDKSRNKDVIQCLKEMGFYCIMTEKCHLHNYICLHQQRKCIGALSEKEYIFRYTNFTLEELVRYLPQVKITKKYFPEFFYSNPRYLRLIRAAEKSRGSRRNKLYAKANKLRRKDECISK